MMASCRIGRQSTAAALRLRKGDYYEGMRYGDLKMLVALAVVSAGAFLLFGAPAHDIASRGAQLAQSDWPYYNENGISPADVDPRYPAYDYAPVTSGDPYAERITEYGGPGAGDRHAPNDWPSSSDLSEIIPMSADLAVIYDPYGPDIVYYTIDSYDEPWYYVAFPGMGPTVASILPPLLRPAIAAPIQPASPPRPTCSIAASPGIVPYGGTAVVSWATSHAASSVLSGVGSVPGTGSRSFPDLTFSQNVALTVTGIGGSNTCTTAITVTPAQRQIPSCTISANPENIRKGENANLAWLSQNAASLSLSGLGSVPQTGGRVVAPAQTTVFTLSVTSLSGDRASCAATITVR